MEFVSPYCLIAGVFKPPPSSSSSSPPPPPPPPPPSSSSSSSTLKYQYFLRGVSLEISLDKLKYNILT
jgi:hypothetical protein